MNTELWDRLCEEEEVRFSFDFENVTLYNKIGGDGANEMEYFFNLYFFLKILAFGFDNFITSCSSPPKLH